MDTGSRDLEAKERERKMPKTRLSLRRKKNRVAQRRTTMALGSARGLPGSGGRAAVAQAHNSNTAVREVTAISPHK